MEALPPGEGSFLPVDDRIRLSEPGHPKDESLDTETAYVESISDGVALDGDREVDVSSDGSPLVGCSINVVDSNRFE